MSIFDPNKDYSMNPNESSNLFDTVMEVQKVLQEITKLLQVPETIKTPPPKQKVEPVAVQQEDEPTEEDPTIYDDLF